MQCEVDELRSSNALLQEEMKKSGEVGDHSYALPSSLDIDKLKFVASQLKEMTELYEKMKARMEKLKEVTHAPHCSTNIRPLATRVCVCAGKREIEQRELFAARRSCSHEANGQGITFKVKIISSMNSVPVRSIA